MTDTVKNYSIKNTISGLDMGVFQAKSEDDALEAMAKDAGYQGYRDLDSQIPSVDGEIVVEEV